jgi:hypothetical protein
MKCSKIKRLLSDYAAHVTAPEQTQRVREHVGRCSRCAAELADLERIVRAAAVQGERTVPRDCWPAVRARLMAADVVTRSVSARRRWGTILTGAVAAAAIATAVILRIPQPPPTEKMGWVPGANRVAIQTGVEPEYLQAYAASRDGRPLASEDGVAIMSAQVGNGD